MSDKHKWEVAKNGYNKEVWLVERDTGRIVGVIEGCKFSSIGPWYASYEGKPIGRYVSETSARNAVEAAVETAIKK